MKTKRNTRPGKKRFAPLLIGAGALFAVIFVFSRSASLSEHYMRHIYPVAAKLLSPVSSLFPFSMYDLFVVSALSCLLVFVVYAVFRKIGFGAFLWHLVRWSVILAAWFYFAWGISYFRKDFHARCDVPRAGYDSDRFRHFVVRFIDEANRSYADCADLDKDDVRRKIESLYQEKHRPLCISYPNGRRRPKPMMFQPLYSKMGVSGYFGPFFNEIHVNNYVMNFDYPFTLAHEMAHQFGVALESEANLYAFIVCAGSDDPIIKYSAYNSVLIYVLNDIFLFLPDEFDDLKATIRPEIIDDLKNNREHWLAARDKTLSDAQRKVYDAYLKTNKIASGHKNYSEVVGLIVSCYGRFVE